jgi:hypothetical protein
MLMLSAEGWINGILAFVIIIFSTVIGFSFFYKSIKSKMRLLSYAALMIVFGWTIVLGTCIDFISIISTGTNTDISEETLAIINYMWIVFSGFCSYIYCVKMIIPEKTQLKRFIFAFIIISYSSFEIFLFLDPLGATNFISPNISGENLIVYHFTSGHISPTSMLITTPLYLSLCGYGFLNKSFQSTGILKKKYRYISLGIFFYTGSNLLEGTGFFPNALIFFRIGLFLSILFWYLGLREEPAEKIKIKVKKQIKIEDGLIRLTERPSQITEEEVSISKESKVCLVCKNKVLGYNVFICPSCETFYHQTCARALEKLENACWACNGPIDEKKPVKLKKEDEEVKQEISINKQDSTKNEKIMKN